MRIVQMASVVFLVALLGCKNAPVSQSDLIGRYEYHSGNRAMGSSCFVLSPYRTYVLGDAKEPLSQTAFSGAPLAEDGH